MGLVSFEDPDGTIWNVWKVETPAARAHLMEPGFRTGWLVFARVDGMERRRLSQVPEDWESLGPARLNDLRLVATTVVAPRTGPSGAVTREFPTREKH